MFAKIEFGDGDLACAGTSGARPRCNLNLLEVAPGKRFEVEYGSGGSIDQKTHFAGADTDFDDRKAVATFDGDFVGDCSRLRGPRYGEYQTRYRK